MNKAVILFLILLTSCQSPKKDIDFTFYTWNIRESYYLKMNHSDTLYYINTYPYEEQNYYTLLNKNEKENIIALLDTIIFPCKKVSFDSDIEDGKTYVFYMKRNHQEKILKIHGKSGSKQFYLLGEQLEKIKNQYKFTPINKTFNLKTIDSLLKAQLPPPIVN